MPLLRAAAAPPLASLCLPPLPLSLSLPARPGLQEELDELGFEPGTQLEVNDDNQAELQLGEEVGRGSFGVVFRAGWRGRDVARSCPLLPRSSPAAPAAPAARVALAATPRLASPASIAPAAWRGLSHLLLLRGVPRARRR